MLLPRSYKYKLRIQLPSIKNDPTDDSKILPVSGTVPERAVNGGFIAIGALATVTPHVTRPLESIFTTRDHQRQSLTSSSNQGRSRGRKFHASCTGVEEADGIQIDASILPRAPIDQLASSKIPIDVRSFDHLVQRWHRRCVIYRRRDIARVYSVTSVQK